MKVCILFGSPRIKGNTFSLLRPFCDELIKNGHQIEVVDLYDNKKIEPCIACRVCQKDWNAFGCVIKDDTHGIFDKVIKSDLILLATPIYSFYCTPPMKALLDRFVYGMNKYYGESKGPSLWAGKKLGILSTCAYPPQKSADLFEEGVKRYCKHSQLDYVGMLCERHTDDSAFMNEEKAENARRFAWSLDKLV